jgi:hypothetical protein
LASAQIPTSGNVFIGYSYSRADSVPGSTVGLNGWEGSLEGKFLPWIGVVADFGAGYGKNDSPIPAITCPTTGCPFIPSSNVRRYTYLIGPRVSVPIRKFTPFAHFLFGAAHINDGGSTDTSFATAVGGGIDYRLIHGIAWRLQGDEIHTRFFGDGQDHFRFSTGIDFRF